jgi:hypothetical protein
MKREALVKPMLIVELFGALMLAAVCAAYILGLPTDTVLHGELAYRITIGIFGSAFLIGSVVILVVANLKK